MVLTLEEMKAHLRIPEEDTSQDEEVRRAMVAAESAIRTHIDDGQDGDSVFDTELEGQLEKAKMAVKQLAASFFENRESETTATMVNTRAFKFLIDQLKTY